MTKTTRKCQLCGSPFPVNTGRGRPRSYCSAECRKWAHAYSTLMSLTDKVLDHALDAEKRRAMRSRFWSLSNMTNRGGRA